MSTNIRYRNPIIPGFHPDPSICRAGEDYFLVTSSFEYFPGVPLFHSRDLVHWRQLGYCLTRDSQLPLAGVRPSGGIFAPTIRYHEGTFYMVTTNIQGGGNFYVTTTDPFGEWSEPIWVAQGGIDPSLLFDGDKVYLSSTGFADAESDPTRKIATIVQSEIDIATGKLLSEPRPVWNGTGGAFPEGPHLYKIGAMYYLMVAEGGTEYGHMETIARSASPWGPFESCPHNPILTQRSLPSPIQATGHADIVEASDGSWWLVCLGIRPNGYPPAHHLGRETFLAPVTWDSAGWPHAGEGGHITPEMVAPRLTPTGWEPPRPESSQRDDFDKPQLALDWNFFGNPDPAYWSLAERPGWLKLAGNDKRLDDGAGVAFLGRRQENFNCEVAALLDYEPEHEGEEAGLTVWMNPRHHYDLVVSHNAGTRQISLRGRIGSLTSTVAQAPLGAGPLTLLVRADRYNYEFAFSQGAAEHIFATLETHYLTKEVAGGFTGVYFAFYASGAGQDATAAFFDWFDYRNLDSPGGLSVESSLRELLANDKTRSLLEQYLPDLGSAEMPDWIANMSLLALAAQSPEQVSGAQLCSIKAELYELSRQQNDQ